MARIHAQAALDLYRRLDGTDRVIATELDGTVSRLEADVILVSTGAHPRVLPEAVPDGERILTWEQVYDLDELPERLIVVGSGVTGAEFAGGYNALGCDVVLVSSRDRVLPSEDADAATVIENVFTRRGMTVLSQSRASAGSSPGTRSRTSEATSRSAASRRRTSAMRPVRAG